jgi:hypothetical protein
MQYNSVHSKSQSLTVVWWLATAFPSSTALEPHNSFFSTMLLYLPGVGLQQATTACMPGWGLQVHSRHLLQYGSANLPRKGTALPDKS